MFCDTHVPTFFHVCCIYLFGYIIIHLSGYYSVQFRATYILFRSYYMCVYTMLAYANVMLGSIII